MFRLAECCLKHGVNENVNSKTLGTQCLCKNFLPEVNINGDGNSVWKQNLLESLRSDLAHSHPNFGKIRVHLFCRRMKLWSAKIYIFFTVYHWVGSLSFCGLEVRLPQILDHVYCGYCQLIY